jgi:hypothetical protein
MRRTGLAFTLVSAAAAGCLTTNPFRVGEPPDDKDRDLVSAAVLAAAPASFTSFARGEFWDTQSTTRTHTYAPGEHTFRWQFAGRLTGAAATGKTLMRLTADERRRALDWMQAEILTAVRATGVEVTIAPPTAPVAGADGEYATEIRYLRNDRTVGGEIHGRVRPCPEQEPFSEMTFTLREFRCK